MWVCGDDSARSAHLRTCQRGAIPKDRKRPGTDDIGLAVAAKLCSIPFLHSHKAVLITALSLRRKLCFVYAHWHDGGGRVSCGPSVFPIPVWQGPAYCHARDDDVVADLNKDKEPVIDPTTPRPQDHRLPHSANRWIVLFADRPLLLRCRAS